MAKSSIEKTNVMRLLDQKKVPYTPHTYPHGDDAVDGVTVAQMTGMDPAKVFTTLVARGASKTPYVFVSPVFAAQALAQETILVSAGKIGYQVETAPQALIALVRATTADLTIEES